jgi:hypothetical protein
MKGGFSVEKIFELLLSKLDAQSVVILLVLFGIWKIAVRFMDKFGEHGDQVVNTLKEIRDDLHALSKDVAVVANRVDGHERRLEKIEGKLEP